jgi:hypothetical protein
MAITCNDKRQSPLCFTVIWIYFNIKDRCDKQFVRTCRQKLTHRDYQRVQFYVTLSFMYPWEGLRWRPIETLAGFHAYNVWQVIRKLPVWSDFIRWSYSSTRSTSVEMLWLLKGVVKACGQQHEVQWVRWSIVMIRTQFRLLSAYMFTLYFSLVCSTVLSRSLVTLPCLTYEWHFHNIELCYSCLFQSHQYMMIIREEKWGERQNSE